VATWVLRVGWGGPVQHTPHRPCDVASSSGTGTGVRNGRLPQLNRLQRAGGGSGTDRCCTVAHKAVSNWTGAVLFNMLACGKLSVTGC
jgi:hypothetical protein